MGGAAAGEPSTNAFVALPHPTESTSAPDGSRSATPPPRGSEARRREHLISRTGARVPGAAEEEERAGCKARPVEKGGERDVARPCRRAVDEPESGQVRRLGSCVEDLDELVRESSLDTGRELVDAERRGR